MKTFNKLVSKGTAFLAKNSGTILTTTTICSMVSSVITAVKATPKAVAKIHEDSTANHGGDPDAYTLKEAVKSAWRFYFPTAVNMAVCVGSTVLNQKISSSKIKALTVTAAVAGELTQNLKDAIIEQYGPELLKNVEAIATDKRIEKAEQKSEEDVTETISEDPEMAPTTRLNHETVVIAYEKLRCIDEVSGREFYASVNQIDHAAVDLSYRMIMENYIPYSDFYDAVGLDKPYPRQGEKYGWVVDDGRIVFDIVPKFDESGRQYFLVRSMTELHENYDKFA